MRQLVELNDNLDDLTAAGATLLAISDDSKPATTRLSRRISPKFSLVSDPDNELAERYAADIRGSAMYWVRPDGTIHYGYTDPINALDRPPLHMVIELAREAADATRAPRASEFDAPCRPHKGAWICPNEP
ncbi:MAG: peroxiredoxin family protein [Myxococcales bacterium]|nr:peroxiredoxin family protein [Myxococcales bacterium]